MNNKNFKKTDGNGFILEGFLSLETDKTNDYLEFTDHVTDRVSFYEIFMNTIFTLLDENFRL